MDASGDEEPPALRHVLGPALSVCLSVSLDHLSAGSEVRQGREKGYTLTPWNLPHGTCCVSSFPGGSWCVTFRTTGEGCDLSF